MGTVPRPRPRLVVVVGLLAIAVFAAATMTLGPGSGSDSLAAAHEVADAWIAGWNENDPVLLASVFTEDGLIHFNDLVVEGPDDIEVWAFNMVPMVSNVERLSQGSRLESGDYLFSIRYQVFEETWTTDLRIRLNGDLAVEVAMECPAFG